MQRLAGGKFKILKGTDSNLRGETDAGIVPTVSSSGVTPIRSLGNADKSRDFLLKKGSGALDVQRNAPLFNDPRYTSSTLSIPTDNRTLHGLYRFFAETDPIVGAALKLHTELPLADVGLGQCEDSGVQRHFEIMWDNLNVVKLLTDIVAEFYEIGDVFPFGAFNETTYMWDQFTILNPDYVKVDSTWVNQRPLIKLIPDENLKRIVQTRSPKFIYEQLPPEIVRYVLFSREIPLDPNNVFHISHAKRPYELRGKSIIKRILKVLMLEDRFNQANFALATRHAVPLTVVKVGDPTTGWIPNDEELNDVRTLFAAWELDPNFSIFYHYGINVEFYGSNGKMLPIGPELERIYRLKFIGLQVHEQLLAGGGGSYSAAYINLEIQRQRYLNLQLRLESFLHGGVFKPVADLCGFYKIHKVTSGPIGSSSKVYGKEDNFKKRLLSQFTSLRDDQDNEEFQKFIDYKTAEHEQLSTQQERDYIYPEIDWGAMSASTDESLKNYIKWLAKERPYLIDDGTLARLGKLDRDDQEAAYFKDLKREADRIKRLSDEGLLELAQSRGKKGGGGGADFGGDIPIDMGGLPTGGGEDMFAGGEPEAPIGEGGAPDAVEGGHPPGMEASIRRSVSADDNYIVQENKVLLKQRSRHKRAIEKEIKDNTVVE